MIKQSDPTSMVIYAIVIMQLALMIVAEVNQVEKTSKTPAYADGLTAAGTIVRLKN